MRISCSFSKSKPAKLADLNLNAAIPRSILLLRHLCSPPKSPQPEQPEKLDQDSVITQAVQLLQASENEWDLDKLTKLLFSSPSSSSPRLFFRITRRLGSSTRALKFFDYVRENSQSGSVSSLSATLHAVIELAGREPDSHRSIFNIYETSRELNVPLTINAAAFLIECLGKGGMVDNAFVIFNELDPSLKNVKVRNTMIRILMRANRLNDALQLLDEMLQPNVKFQPDDVTGDIVFGNLARREGIVWSIGEEKIANLVSKFAEHNVFMSAVRLTQLVFKICRNKKTDFAWNLLCDLMASGAPVEAASCNALLTGLGKGRHFERMNLLMQKMKDMDIQPNVVTFGILINHLCKFRRVDEALEVFKRMSVGEEVEPVTPDVIIYNTLIDGLCKVGRQQEGLDFMEQMRSQGNCSPSTATYNCLFDGFCKAGEIDEAFKLFEEMNDRKVLPNVITLNTLVDGMCKHARINRAVVFFKEMQKKGVKGNAVTYSVFINAFCNANNIAQALVFFDEMMKNNCSPDAIVYYTLISGLTQAGRLADAEDIVKKLKDSGLCLDLVCYNVLISGFCQTNKLEKAHQMLKEMEEAGLKPDSVTYNTLISSFSKKGDFKISHKIMQAMKSQGLDPTVVTYGALINAYCLNGHTEEAMKILGEMSGSSKIPPNTVIYNIIINSLCKKDEGDRALSLFDEMGAKGIKPNATTYNAVFKTLKEKNWLEKAYELMDRMVEQGCDPDYITMEILTEWLSAIGKTEKLRNFVHGYKVSEPDSGPPTRSNSLKILRKEKSLVFKNLGRHLDKNGRVTAPSD